MVPEKPPICRCGDCRSKLRSMLVRTRLLALPRPLMHVSFGRFALVLSFLVPALAWAVPGDDAPPPPEAPQVAAASDEAEKAMKSFRVPPGLEVRLFAAEPDVANPVAFTVADDGKVYVCESFRQSRGIEDNRG